VVTARRNQDKSLSDGVVVEASVIARLLGIKLLRLNAYITLMPAHLEPITYLDAAAPQQHPDHPTEDGLSEAVKLLAHATQTMDDAKRTTF
jgi:hypothetical protein